jgi:tyrosine-specific transport protein
VKNNNNLLSAIAILVGTCIGAGIFGLPYVISKVGIIIGVLYILVLGVIVMITSLAYGEVILRTNGTHQFPEYVNIYLGSRLKRLAVITFTIGFYGALTAYLIEVGKFLYKLFNPIIGGNVVIYQILYFFFVAIAIFFGLKAVAKIEKILMFAVLLIIIFLLLFGYKHIDTSNLFAIDWKLILLPYGVILFAITGSSAIPDMKSILNSERFKLKKAIIIGYLIPIIVYIITAIVIVGICGISTTESAVEGLGGKLGSIALFFGFIFGIITMTTSFLSIGLTLKEVYQFDLKINKYISWLIVVLPPLVFVLLNLLTFIELIGMTGAIIGGIDGILMIMIYKKAKQIGQRKPEYNLQIPAFFPYIIYGIYGLGIIYEAYIAFIKLY